MAGILFGAAAECLRTFLRNNWGCSRGSFLAVLHTWGSQLNWHPHLHVLATAGGVGARSGEWKQVRADYAFPVRAMSKVFKAIFLRKLEELDADRTMRWPGTLRSVEQRRDWRVGLCARSWNIHAKATLHNTRAAVRYLARYTSRIAISNTRIASVDPEARTVRFGWTDYRDGGRKKESTLPGAEFIRRFARHMVPPGFRRVRQYGLLCGRSGRFREHRGAPRGTIAEEAPARTSPECPCCKGTRWTYLVIRFPGHRIHQGPARSFSHGGAGEGPDPANGRRDQPKTRHGPQANPRQDGPAARDRLIRQCSTNATRSTTIR